MRALSAMVPCPMGPAFVITAGWTFGAALLSAGRVLAASILFRIAEFLWGRFASGQSFRLSAPLCLFAPSSGFLLLPTRSLDLFSGNRTKVVRKALG